jgi:endonuclease YncB( thermonuclease family)
VTVLRSFLLGAALFPTAVAALADVLSGRIVAVADGDTLTVLDSARRQHKVRLAGIDAPEKKQPFGTVSRQSLAQLTHGKQVLVEWYKRDRYGRLVGKVYVGNLDVNLEQVRRGLAWHYLEYASEQAPADRTAYSVTEYGARSARRGLWADPRPVPPWEWRQRVKGE